VSRAPLPKEFFVVYAGVKGRKDTPSVATLQRRGWRAVHEFPNYPGSFIMVRETPSIGRFVALVVALALVALLSASAAAYVLMVYDSHHDYIGQESE
jgi:hypothetical protein